MDTWKTSTLLVIGAFVLSIGFLLLSNNSRDSKRIRVQSHADNEIYSPAAADPDLRSPELADRLRASAKPKPRKAAQKKTIPAPKPRKTKPKVHVQKTTKPLPVKNSNVPAGHHYYVIVGTYSNPQNAERALASFQKKNAGKPFVGVFNEGQRFSVVAQTFKDEAVARKFVKSLREDHNWTDAFINYVTD